MKGSFLIIAKEKGIITEKGVRAFIMEKLLNSPFSRGSVFNVDEKTVKVQLEGDEKQIREFIEDLEKSLVAQFGNPIIYFAPFQENPMLEIPELMRSSQALVVGQLQKGISVQLDILDTLRGLRSNDEGTQGILRELKTNDEGVLSTLKELKTNHEGALGILKELKTNHEGALGILKELKTSDENALATLKDLKVGNENIVYTLKGLPYELAKVLRKCGYT